MKLQIERDSIRVEIHSIIRTLIFAGVAIYGVSKCPSNALPFLIICGLPIILVIVLSERGCCE